MKKRLIWLDSIRAFALILVLIYHYFGNLLPAGFFGVDIFFFLSGFLITGSILDHLARDGDFDPGQFLKKRVIRLLPPLVLMLAVSFPLLLTSNPDFRVDIGRQLAGVLGFFTNWFEIASGGSYEGQFIPHVYLHTWSLALEFHFYLLFAWLFTRMVKKTMGKEWDRGRLSLDEKKTARLAGSVRMGAAIVVFIGFVISAILPALGAKFSWPRSFLYFSDFTRFIPFFLGAFLATITGIHWTGTAFRAQAKRLPASIRLIFMGLAAFAMVLLSINFAYDQDRTYSYGFLLASLLAGVMVFNARALNEIESPWKDPKPLAFLASISYEVYLFHWPFYVIFNHRGSHGLAVFLSLVLALAFGLFCQKVWNKVFINFFEGIGKKRKDKEKARKQTRFTQPGSILRPEYQARSDKGKIRHKKLATVCLLAVFAFAIVSGVSTVKGAPSLLSVQRQLWADGVRQRLDMGQGLIKEVQAVEDEEVRASQVKEEMKKEGVTVIGDSVALGMRGALMEAIPGTQVNAKVSRFLREGIPIMEDMIKRGEMKKYLVVALGNNVAPSFRESAETMVDLLPEGGRMIFVTPFQKGLGDESDVIKYGKWLPRLADKYPFVAVADWHGLANQHLDYFNNTDGVHFYENPQASDAYVSCIKAALDELSHCPAKGEE